MNQAKPVRLLGLHTTLETCGSISGEASFSSSLNCLVYGFKSIPCLSFGSRNGDSIAKIGGYGIRCMIDGMNMASILVMAQY